VEFVTNERSKCVQRIIRDKARHDSKTGSTYFKKREKEVLRAPVNEHEEKTKGEAEFWGGETMSNAKTSIAEATGGRSQREVSEPGRRGRKKRLVKTDGGRLSREGKTSSDL